MNADWTLERAVWKVSEIAPRIGCSARAVREACERGDVETIQTPGGHYRVTREALRRWLGLDAPKALAA